MSLNVPLVLNNFWHIFVSVLVLMFANGLGIFLIAKLTKSSLEEALDRAFVMALGGEFAFVLFAAAASQKVISEQVQANGTAIIVLSMVLSPLLMLFYKFVILPRLHKNTSARPELLATAGIEQAALLVVAVDSRKDTDLIVENARRLNASVPIIVRTFDRRHTFEMFTKTDVQVRETFDSAIRIGKEALLKMGLDAEKVEEIGRVYFEKDRHNLRLMAEVYDPTISGFKNQALQQMAIEQDQELTALIQEIVNRED